MKILICTFNHFDASGIKVYTHCGDYYSLLFKQAFEALGHSVQFVGPKVKGDPYRHRLNEFDVCVWWGLEATALMPEYASKLAEDFKGNKVLYITTEKYMPMFSNMTHIFGTDIPRYSAYYKKHFPNVKFQLLPFSAPMFDWIDADKSDPFPKDEHPRIIYTGLITPNQLNILTAIARHGLKIYVGGKYLEPGKPSRGFTPSEVAKLHKNITLITPDGKFNYGAHWRWLHNADLAINVYPQRRSNSVSSKIVDYLVCGLPVVSEDSAPNNFYLKAYNAGLEVKFNDPTDMIRGIEQALKTKWDKEAIKQRARKAFDPVKVCRAIIEAIA